MSGCGRPSTRMQEVAVLVAERHSPVLRWMALRRSSCCVSWLLSGRRENSWTNASPSAPASAPTPSPFPASPAETASSTGGSPLSKGAATPATPVPLFRYAGSEPLLETTVRELTPRAPLVGSRGDKGLMGPGPYGFRREGPSPAAAPAPAPGPVPAPAPAVTWLLPIRAWLLPPLALLGRP